MRISGKAGMAILVALSSAAFAAPAQAEWVASWAAPPHAPLGTEGPFAAAVAMTMSR